MSGNPPQVRLEIFKRYRPFCEDYTGFDLTTCKLKENHKPKYRYLAASGGRGSGKSIQIAKALLMVMMVKKVFVLYLRQMEKVVDDSIKKMLESLIYEHQLESYFKIYADRIFCVHNRSEVYFRGVRDTITARSVKGIYEPDILILEEAEAFTMEVLEILGPCLRAANSQIWAIWNPFEELDAVYVKWFLNNPDAYYIKANWIDNPLFPEALKKEMERDQKLVEAGLTSQEKFNNIWWGEPLANNPMGLCSAETVNYCASNAIDFEAAARTLHELESKVGNRIEHLQRLLVPLKDRRAVGVDTGLHGDDPAVMVMVNETQVVKWKSIPHCTGTHLFNAVKEFVNFDKKIMINMDASNEEGICDFLKDAGYNLNAIKFAGQAKRNVHGDYVKGTSDLYLNARQEMAFELRYLVNNRLIQIPDDHLLKVQLKNYEYSEKIVNAYVILVLEEKKKYKDRMKHSPDFFDALGLAIYTPFRAALPGIG